LEFGVVIPSIVSLARLIPEMLDDAMDESSSLRSGWSIASS
jgi:hypothetical protein